jgi:hypothetical protein
LSVSRGRRSAVACPPEVVFWVSNRDERRLRALVVMGARSPSEALARFHEAFPEEPAGYAYFKVDGVESWVRKRFAATPSV